MLVTQRAIDQAEIDRAIAIDEVVTGSKNRSEYITSVAARGGLSVALQQDEVRAFVVSTINTFLRSHSFHCSSSTQEPGGVAWD